jgi:hypothetical protein
MRTNFACSKAVSGVILQVFPPAHILVLEVSCKDNFIILNVMYHMQFAPLMTESTGQLCNGIDKKLFFEINLTA